MDVGVSIVGCNNLREANNDASRIHLETVRGDNAHLAIGRQQVHTHAEMPS